MIPGTQLRVENIFCIGRNFAEHARELGNEIPAEPIVFLKPTSSLSFDGDTILIPKQSKQVDHELEIVIAIGRSGKNLNENEACSVIEAIGIGVDFTARDIQRDAKKNGLPWTLAKGFDTFAAISNFVEPPKDLKKIQDLHMTLKVNGEVRQQGTSREMIFSIPQLIAFLSRNFSLSPGDLIFTGTPQGVAPIKTGDIIEASLENFTSLRLKVLDDETQIRA